MIVTSGSAVATWLISAAAVVGIIARPWKLPEASWAASGAALLVLCSLISPSDAWTAVCKGTDVYLFLTGMMLLSELARHERLFDWLAAVAVQRAQGSGKRLFALVYGVGVVITVFLSNDATALVLTPAVYAAAARAQAKPLPYLYLCAFVANAASFVLPISNPANLVVYTANMPSLAGWLAQFGLASVLSVSVTFIVLRWMQRAELSGDVRQTIPVAPLSLGGRLAAGGIAATALVLLISSSLDRQLGMPTCVSAIGTAGAIFFIKRVRPWRVLKDISWSVLPLVAGLFVIVAAVEGTGVLRPLVEGLPRLATAHPDGTAFGAGALVALVCNLANNLPVGLLVGSVAGSAHLSAQVTGALLLAVDLGPNLSVTGSLATLLWLVALRREGQEVSAWKFLILGSVAMPLALIAALVGFLWLRPAG